MKDDPDSQRNGKGGSRGGKGGSGGRGNNNRDRSRSPHDRSSSTRSSRRVYVANVPFDVKWSELKDLFREKVGNVAYCQLFEDEQGRSRGCGLIEFNDVASAKKAIDTLHRFEFKNRELVVKEDLDCERDRYGRLLLPGKNRLEEEEHMRFSTAGSIYDQPTASSASVIGSSSIGTWNTYGLSPQFLDSLGVSGPLNNRIFVANLDYKVGEKKLEEIFKLAGKVLRVRLYTDSTGQSKGHGTVEFDHPVESVQAISMFHDQKLYGRPMSIRMDKYECEDVAETLPQKLPQGLEGVGKGLGINGQPLNVSKSLLCAANAPPSIAPQSMAQQTPVVPNASTGQVVVPGSALVPGVMSQHISSGHLTTGQATGHMQATAPPNAVAMGMGVDARTNAGLTHQNNLVGPSSMASSMSSGISVQPMIHSNVPQTAGNNNNGIYPTGTIRGLGATGLQGGQQSMNTPVSMVSNSNMNTSSGSGMMLYEREFRDPMIAGPQSNMVGSMVGMMGGNAADRAPGPSSVVSDTVVVRNLPPSVSWQVLRDRFSEVADVRYAELKGPGTALIRFSTERDAQRSVQVLNGSRFENRLIEVSFY